MAPFSLHSVDMDFILGGWLEANFVRGWVGVVDLTDSAVFQREDGRFVD